MPVPTLAQALRWAQMGERGPKRPDLLRLEMRGKPQVLGKPRQEPRELRRTRLAGLMAVPCQSRAKGCRLFATAAGQRPPQCRLRSHRQAIRRALAAVCPA